MRRREGCPTKLPGGVVRLCAGVVECARGAPYLEAMERAGQIVCNACDDLTEPQARRLVRALRHNLVNRKRYPVQQLLYSHDLPIARRRFYQERRRYCMALLQELGMLEE